MRIFSWVIYNEYGFLRGWVKAVRRPFVRTLRIFQYAPVIWRQDDNFSLEIISLLIFKLERYRDRILRDLFIEDSKKIVESINEVVIKLKYFEENEGYITGESQGPGFESYDSQSIFLREVFESIAHQIGYNDWDD